MEIKQFKYSQDNFGYLIYGQKNAVAVDPGAVKPMMAFIDANHLKLEYVVNTHSHGDHTVGNKSMLAASHAKFLDTKALIAEPEIDLGEFSISVISTPGHSNDSVTLAVDRFLITGDTLFNGTIGNCFSGNMKAFYESLTKLLTFDDQTIIYAGHDYVIEAMEVARRFEPNNPDIDTYLQKYNPEHVFSTMGDERQVNPYIRYNAPEIVEMIKRGGLPAKSEFERFNSLMTIE